MAYLFFFLNLQKKFFSLRSFNKTNSYDLKMKKNLLALLCILLLLKNIPATALENETYSLPQEFYIVQRWISLTLAFDIKSSNGKLGTVYRKFWSLGKEYDFYDNTEKMRARAKSRLLSFCYVFDVTDEADIPIGRVEQRFFTLFPTFDLIAAHNEVLAVAKMNFWGTTYTLKDPLSKAEIATLSRSFFRFKDDWTVNITRPDIFISKRIDPRLFITVVAFQTDHENDQRYYSHNTSLPPMSSNYKVDLGWDSTVEPQEEDFEAIVQLTEEGVDLDEEDELLSARLLQNLTALIHNNELTPGQKSALSILLQEKLTPL